MTFVLDASAVLALLLDERGAEIVQAVIRGSELSSINLSEVLAKTVEAGGDVAAVRQIVAGYGVVFREFGVDHATAAAELRPLTRHLGLSLGDRACLAHARLSKRPVLTADRAMAAADLGLDIRLIR